MTKNNGEGGAVARGLNGREFNVGGNPTMD